MTDALKALDNLVKTGGLKREETTATEINGLIRLGSVRFEDAARQDNSFESRFDLAYNAAHAFSLAALRSFGYRSENRYLVFQTTAHTLQFPAAKWRVLTKAHDVRNLAEYEGHFEADEQLLTDLIDIATEVKMAVIKMVKK